MAEVVGAVAAAFQFAEVTVKAIKLVREIQKGAEAGTVRHKITQLETFVEVAQKIADSWTQDDPLTEKILKQCTSTVTDLTGRLERVDVAGSDRLKEKTKKALRARWEKDDIEELFRQLCRDQAALLLHRSFASDSQLVQKVMDGIRRLLEARLESSKPPDPDERRFLDGIFITDPRDDRSALVTLKGHRAEGTCAWVTESDAYRSWLSTTPGPTGLMFQGSPGKGKTMMAIYLTEQLELLSDNGQSVIYVFCDNRNPKQNNALAIVRCLMWQLCRLRPAVLRHGIKELQDRGGSIDNLLSFETLWRIFDDMRQDEHSGSITCVIDGLDECDDNSVFAILNKLWRLKPDPRFKFLILCRPPTPRQQLPAATTNVVRLLLDSDEDEKVHQDVIEFIRQRVREVANASPERQWSEKLRMHVEATLQQKADGTFLWVGFVTKDLQRRTSTEVRKYLKSLPADLNEIYDRILKGLPTEYRARIRSLLRWITLAEHPMRLSELVSLINTHNVQTRPADSDNDSDADSFFETEEDILQDLLAFIGHFILISGRTVYFVHQSAKDYLLRSCPATDADLEYFRILDREAGHEELAHQCLDYLHRQLSLIKKEDGWGSEEYEYTSFHYALHFWLHHVKHSGRTFRYPDTIEKIVRLFRPDDLLWQWLQCLGQNSSVGLDLYSCHTRTAYNLCRHEISDLGATANPLVDSSDSGCHPPTGIVCRQKPGLGCDIGFAISLDLDAAFDQMLGDLTVDEYASAFGAEPHVFNWPLHIALSSRKDRHFQRLLDKYGSTAVSREKGLLGYAVSQAGRMRPQDYPMSIDRLFDTQGAGDRIHINFNFCYLDALLAFTAEPRSLYGRDLDEALFQAVERLKTDMIQLLLDKGADINAVDGNGDTVLHQLVRRFEEGFHSTEILKVADVLLSQKIQRVRPNATDNDGNTPLHLAVFLRGIEFVHLLLEHGATLNVVNLEGRTPLHMAAICRCYWDRSSARKIAELLASGSILVPTSATDSIPFVDMQDRHGQTALHLASENGNKSVARVLLAHNASLECRDYQGRTALHMVAAGRRPSTLRLLLDAGAHVNAVDAQGRTPLVLLVEAIDERGVLGLRALCMARLIRVGAVCSGKDAEGRTLLHNLARKLEYRAQKARDWVQMTCDFIRQMDDDIRVAQERKAQDTSEVSPSGDPWATQAPVPTRWDVPYPTCQIGADGPSAGMKRGAVFVSLPHRHRGVDAKKSSAPSRFDVSEQTWIFDDYRDHEQGIDWTVRRNHKFGGKMRRYLAELSIDETMKDNQGMTAREYYPDDKFWEGTEDEMSRAGSDGCTSPLSESDGEVDTASGVDSETYWAERDADMKLARYYEGPDASLGRSSWDGYSDSRDEESEIEEV